MADNLAEQHRLLMAAQAQAVGGAEAAIALLAAQGLNPPAMIAALLTAATAVVESSFAPGERLGVLNAALAETIHEWATAAATAKASGATGQ